MAKILLVEDDKSLREIYGVRLQAEGYEIVSAGDGEEALAMAIKEKPDLIVSDVMMPKISGFDMLDILRSTTETKNVKVIMMTALSSDDQRARGEALGADRYLVKSQVGIEDVVRTVHDVLADGLPAPAEPAAFPSSATPISNPVPGFTPAPGPEPAPLSFEPTPPAAASYPEAPGPLPMPAAPVFEPVAPTPVFSPEPAYVEPAPVAPAPQPAPQAPVYNEIPAPAPQPQAVPGFEPAPASAYAPAPVESAYAPEPVAQPAPVEQPAPQPAPTAPAPTYAPVPPAPTYPPEPAPAPQAAPAFAPAPQPAVPNTLPQPTAPFSSPAPASLGERVIQPLTDLNAAAAPTDLSSQMDQALGNALPPAQGNPPTPPAL